MIILGVYIILGLDVCTLFFVPTLTICRSILFVFPKPICSLMTTFVSNYHSSSIALPLSGPSNSAKMASRSFSSYIVFFFYATFDSKGIWLGTNKTLSPPQTFGNFFKCHAILWHSNYRCSSGNITIQLLFFMYFLSFFLSFFCCCFITL